MASASAGTLQILTSGNHDDGLELAFPTGGNHMLAQNPPTLHDIKVAPIIDCSILGSVLGPPM